MLRLRLIDKAVCLLASTCCASQAIGSDYSESVAGDLSNDRFAPTRISIDASHTRVSGSIQRTDLDYFVVSIPAGKGLHALILESYEGDNPRAFIAMQAGNIFTVEPETASPPDLLGYTHFGLDPSPPTDLLDDMSRAPFAIGFSRPVGAGDLCFWINQTEPILTRYRFRFVVPTPGDANLDAIVDFDDLLILAQHYGQSGQLDWSSGDFDASGSVDFADLLSLAQNYQSAPLISDTLGSDTPFSTDWSNALALVPEPTLILTTLILIPGRHRFS